MLKEAFDARIRNRVVHREAWNCWEREEKEQTAAPPRSTLSTTYLTEYEVAAPLTPPP